MTPVLHIHGQSRWHMSAVVVGNRAALLGLRDAIDRALKGECRAAVETFSADGEGYEVEVRLRDADMGAPEWNNARLPYFDEIARDGADEI